MSWIVVASLSLLFASFDAATQPAAKIRVALVGDSTVTDSSGWGVGFKNSLTDDVEVINLALGGRSSKSYRDEGHWDTKVLPSRADYVLIQFGHNDCPGKGPKRETDPATTYRANMKRYVDEARAAGMKPILVTSLTRRKFRADGKIHSDLFPYVDAVKAVAAETNTPLIDLHARSIELCNQQGPEGCEAISPPPKAGENKPDQTHLNERGSALIGALVAHDLRKVFPELAKYVQSEPRSTTGPASR
jgi:lysophospholipase L1-like esterase